MPRKKCVAAFPVESTMHSCNLLRLTKDLCASFTLFCSFRAKKNFSIEEGNIEKKNKEAVELSLSN